MGKEWSSVMPNTTAEKELQEVILKYELGDIRKDIKALQNHKLDNTCMLKLMPKSWGWKMLTAVAAMLLVSIPLYVQYASVDTKRQGESIRSLEMSGLGYEGEIAGIKRRGEVSLITLKEIKVSIANLEAEVRKISLELAAQQQGK